MATTQGRLYFIALQSRERLDIQYVPDDLTIDRSPSIADVAVIGRNNPVHHYSSGKTSLKLQLDFYAEEEDRQDVIRKCRWLESLGYSDGLSRPPEQIKLVFGDLFRDEIWIVKKVSYKLSNFNKEYGFLPQQAYVDVSLALDPKTNLRIKDIK